MENGKQSGIAQQAVDDFATEQIKGILLCLFVCRDDVSIRASGHFRKSAFAQRAHIPASVVMPLKMGRDL